jgi:serine/threonine protein kinase
MLNGNLANHLHRHRDYTYMPWARRLKICIDTARGLDYLHTGTFDGIQHVIHRDVKSSNILLDGDLTAKISDFGISIIGPTPTEMWYPRVSRPSQKLSCKSDVYAFGVVLIEVVSGRRALDIELCMDECLLSKWVKRCINEGNVDEIVDVNLKSEISQHYLSVFGKLRTGVWMMILRTEQVWLKL